MSNEKVHFLDVASSLPGTYHVSPHSVANPVLGYRQSWSPNTLKTRLLLNAKQIPYTEQFVSYPDIAPLLSSYGIKPNTKGTPYTLPAIQHESVPGMMMMGSIEIARHLDALYPDAPVHAFPEPKDQSKALWAESQKTFNSLIFPPNDAGFQALVFPKIPGILDPRGTEYFIRTRTEEHPERVSPLQWGSDPEQDFQAMVPAFNAYNRYLISKQDQATHEGRGAGPFLWGETVTMGDVWLVSCLVWLRSAGEEWLDRLLASDVGMVRGVWEAFESRGWLTGQGEERELQMHVV